MADIEIYGAPQSTYVRIAWMTCEEKNAPYVIRPAAPHSAVVLAIHPFGRIPVMRHGDVELFESKAIATYIDRTFEGPMLIPADAYGAARVVDGYLSSTLRSNQPGCATFAPTSFQRARMARPMER